MSHNMQYDKTEPQHVPIIISIIITVALIIGLTFSLIYFFKGTYESQKRKNQQTYGQGFELKQLRNYEQSFLQSSNSDKVTIDESMRIIINSYN